MARYEHHYHGALMLPKLNPDDFYRGRLRKPEQAKFIQTLEEASKLPGDNYCEIGVRKAGSSLCIVQVLNKLNRHANLFCIDPDVEARLSFNSKIKKPGTCKASFILGRSQDVSDQVPNQLVWLFIDGCHCFECVKSDIEVYCPKIDKNGIVVIHDCDWRIQLRDATQGKTCGHELRKVGVYEAMMTSSILQDEFFLVYMMEGTCGTNVWWDGLAIWRRR